MAEDIEYEPEYDEPELEGEFTDLEYAPIFEEEAKDIPRELTYDERVLQLLEPHRHRAPVGGWHITIHEPDFYDEQGNPLTEQQAQMFWHIEGVSADFCSNWLWDRLS